ncbi:MAG: hypothetical protein V8Q76_01670 [Bacteroides intestinalis]
MVVNYTGHGSTLRLGRGEFALHARHYPNHIPTLLLYAKQLLVTLPVSLLYPRSPPESRHLLNAKGGVIALLTTSRLADARQNSQLNEAFLRSHPLPP